jgi:hypothetical protein
VAFHVPRGCVSYRPQRRDVSTTRISKANADTSSASKMELY